MLGRKKGVKELKMLKKILNSQRWCRIKHQKSAYALIGGFVTNP
jgi:hypothetical protein